LVYQVTDYYNPRGDATLLWNDPEIGIQWPISDPVISAKDAEAPALSALDPQKLAW
jgi:dTDP-4-dehydrorhamnose 3,5-epimerase